MSEGLNCRHYEKRNDLLSHTPRNWPRIRGWWTHRTDKKVTDPVLDHFHTIDFLPLTTPDVFGSWPPISHLFHTGYRRFMHSMRSRYFTFGKRGSYKENMKDESPNCNLVTILFIKVLDRNSTVFFGFYNLNINSLLLNYWPYRP